MPLLKMGSGLVLLVLAIQTPLNSDSVRDTLVHTINAIVPAAREQTWPLGKFAYVSQSDSNSENAIELQSENLDYIIPDWYFLTTDDCMIDSRVYPKIKEVALATDLDVLPLYQNQDTRGIYLDQTRKILQNPELRNCVAMELVKSVKADAAKGAVISFAVPADLEDSFLEFIKETDTLFAQNNLNLYVTVDADNGNLADIAGACDGVLVNMYHAYNQLNLNTAPAPTDWFTQKLARVVKLVPKDKLIIMIGQFGADVSAGTSASPQELSFSASNYEAQKLGSNLAIDDDSGNLLAVFVQKSIWLLGPHQAQEQLNQLISNDVQGVGIYRLGTEHQIVWNLLKNPTKQISNTLDPPQYVYHETKGEILTVSAKPSPPGTNPTGYIISRYGDELPEKSIFITFDDGPDPKWTPLIIDLLKLENVPAAFFVVGEQLEYWPEIATLLNDPLFTIGNHSYDHPHLDEIPKQEILNQTASTTRLIQNLTGKKPRFFRLTYDVNTMPTKEKTIHAIDTISEQGYIIVGAAIDSRDWDNPNVEDAVNSIMQSLKADKHIIVFHDGGGDRLRTIEILKKLIPEARESGYEFLGLESI
ncbi:MAG: polysaccharide deacetylase family protein [Patescibacteria group bacterium]|nr:polysaccharide deacetylase family protein [Patescibacteria group bacterium]